MNVIKDTIVNKNLKFIYSPVLFCYISYVANILCVECPIILCLDLTIRPLQTTAFLSHCSTPFSPPRLSTPTTLLSSTSSSFCPSHFFFSFLELLFSNCSRDNPSVSFNRVHNSIVLDYHYYRVIVQKKKMYNALPSTRTNFLFIVHSIPFSQILHSSSKSFR